MGKKVEEQLEFIRNPDLWPRWPLLPMIHRKDMLFAVMVDDGQYKKLYLANICNSSQLKNLLTDVPVLEFSSTEELLEAGWEID